MGVPSDRQCHTCLGSEIAGHDVLWRTYGPRNFERGRRASGVEIPDLGLYYWQSTGFKFLLAELVKGENMVL